ncbi:EAL domain-containing protein [Rugamonas sp.]|uniref:EAL domain-containing protein n=1 Tax=Rugamonas sp. TaxID=1926287 RepID=UPI0025E5C994|nr:EAL domain-containing protein [Rugamonas sp.]
MVGRIEDDVEVLQEELEQRQAVAERLLDSESRFRQLADNIGEVFFLIDLRNRQLLYISPAYETVWGRSCASLYAQPDSWMDAIHPDDVAHVRALERDWAGDPGRAQGFEYNYRIVRRDGQLRHIHDRGFPIRDADGRVYRIAGLAADVTEHHAQSQRLNRLGQLYAMLSGVNAAIIRCGQRDALLQEVCRLAVDQGAFSMAWAGVLDADTGAGTVLASSGGPPGYAAQIRFSGAPGGVGAERPASVAAREQRIVLSDDIGADPALAALREELLGHGLRAVAALPLHDGQRTCAVLVLFAAEAGFFGQEGRRALLDELTGDLSFGMQFLAKEARLQYLAYYDALTGLPNRALFLDRVAALPAGRGVAVAVIDVERFSQLDDAVGRAAGDAVLRRVGQLLGDADGALCVARLDGDGYALALPVPAGADADVATAALEAVVLPLLDLGVQLEQQLVRVTSHAGIALAPPDGADAAALLEQAESALAQAQAGGERLLFYAARMNQSSQARLRLEADLRAALPLGELSMHYQPRVDLTSGRVVSAEALVRWRHPERGMVAPAEFIPLAEQTGLIVVIGSWVIDTVCAQQAAWKARRLRVVPVAINLSAVQFRRGQVQGVIRAALARHGLAPHEIEFELTESVVMADPEQAAQDLKALKGLGVKLALDDFGTGYSSLAYLKRFPFDFVKIDRAFITDVTKSAEDAAIATAIIAMAHSLGLRVVAEGVETEGQLQFLRRHRCDELQGYYFSRPLAADAFAALLAEGRRLALTPEAVQQEDTLLIVDDEEINLMALRRLLRQEGYRVLTAAGGEEALELLALNPVQVVLSDQRMPGMSGARFLALVKELYPDTVRMMLSASTDFNAVADSVNQGAVYKYLSKPWDGDALRRHLRDAFYHQRTRMAQ